MWTAETGRKLYRLSIWDQVAQSRNLSRSQLSGRLLWAAVHTLNPGISLTIAAVVAGRAWGVRGYWLPGPGSRLGKTHIAADSSVELHALAPGKVGRQYKSVAGFAHHYPVLGPNPAPYRQSPDPNAFCQQWRQSGSHTWGFQPSGQGWSPGPSVTLAIAGGRHGILSRNESYLASTTRFRWTVAPGNVSIRSCWLNWVIFSWFEAAAALRCLLPTQRQWPPSTIHQGIVSVALSKRSDSGSRGRTRSWWREGGWLSSTGTGCRVLALSAPRAGKLSSTLPWADRIPLAGILMCMSQKRNRSS